MTVSRPPRLTAGDELLYLGNNYTVTTLSGIAVAMTDATGWPVTVRFVDLFADPALSVVARAWRKAPLPAHGVLEGLPAELVQRAEWWERHLAEVLTGTPPGAPVKATPRAEYDPLRSTLRQREVSKIAELAAGGEPVPLSTLQRMRHRYQSDGLLGLVDGRTTRTGKSTVDERVTAAIAKAVAAETDRSRGTVTRLRRRVEQILAREYDLDPAEVMPPRTTFYRLAERAAAGRHTFGSAPTRRSLAQRPDGPFGAVTVLRPGAWMPSAPHAGPGGPGRAAGPAHADRPPASARARCG